MSRTDLESLEAKIRSVKKVRLFLDYDGTLADFAPTPDVIIPDDQIIDLLDRLVQASKYLPAVISGRRLAHVRELLPVKGLLLAGTYGLEFQLPDGSSQSIVDYHRVRPVIHRAMEQWGKLIQGKSGYYLEDKGWATALHARFADPLEADGLLQNARAALADEQLSGEFRILGGERFLEIAPAAASKANAVRQIMEMYTPPETFAVYIGDDDKDEEGFEEVKRWRGDAVRVAARDVPTIASYRISKPARVLTWLDRLLTLQ